MAASTVMTQTFTPNQIPGCQLWFDAADNTTFSYSSGTSISEWRDKSSNAYSVIQPTSLRQPFLSLGVQNSLPGIQFSQNTFLYQLATSMPNFTSGPNTSVLIAARNASINSSWNIINTVWFDANGSGATQRYHFSFNQNTVTGTTLYTNASFVGQVTSNAVAVSANAILGFTTSSTSQTIHTNSSSDSYAGTTLPNATGNSAFIFGDARNNAASANIIIFEMVGYNNQITLAQRQQLEGYLAWKWQMVDLLPVSHPYKTVPILSLPPFPFAPRVKRFTNASNFLPTQISGCSLWYDASDLSQITRSGANVTNWTSKGSSITSVTNSTNYPTYLSNAYNGLGTIRFSFATNQALSNASVASSVAQTNASHAIFLVHNPNANNSTPFGFLDTTGTGAKRLSVVTPEGSNISYDVGGTRLSYIYPSQAAYLNGNLRLETFYVSNPTRGYRRDGTELASNAMGSFAYDATQILYIGGAQPSYGGYAYGGDYCEIVWYNLPLTTPQIQQVEGYLAWKWGTQAFLANTHPYKTTPPYSSAPFPLVPQVKVMNNRVFSPNSIPGCSLWLDAADSSTVTRSGTNVTAVRDKSLSNVTLSNATGFTYPNNTFNGRYPSFFVNGGGNSGGGTQRLGVNATLALATPFTVSFICQHVGAANYGYILDSGPGGTGRPYIYDASPGPRFDTVFGSGGTSLLATSPLINSFIIGSSSAAFQNGTQQFTGSVSFTTGGLTIGNRFSLNESWPGHICEFIIHNTALTRFQRQQIEGYFAWKWGLVGSLPANHPYKLFPPSPQ